MPSLGERLRARRIEKGEDKVERLGRDEIKRLNDISESLRREIPIASSLTGGERGKILLLLDRILVICKNFSDRLNYQIVISGHLNRMIDDLKKKKSRHERQQSLNLTIECLETLKKRYKNLKQDEEDIHVLEGEISDLDDILAEASGIEQKSEKKFIGRIEGDAKKIARDLVEEARKTRQLFDDLQAERDLLEKFSKDDVENMDIDKLAMLVNKEGSAAFHPDAFRLAQRRVDSEVWRN